MSNVDAIKALLRLNCKLCETDFQKFRTSQVINQVSNVIMQFVILKIQTAK